MSEITDKQIEALIAMALSPNLSPELTDAEIDQFIKEYDEGKHPLSDADKDAMATGGFRQYLKASLELDKLRTHNQKQADKIAEMEREVLRLRQVLKKAHDAMFSWYSSEYASHPLSQEVSKELYE